MSLDAEAQRRGLGAQCAALARDIKLSHTLFALPWAVLAMFLAADSVPATGITLLVLACMVCARSMAMTMNRLLDAGLDARNPRTSNRAIPGGRMSRAFEAGAVVLTSMVFMLCTAGFWWLYGNVWPMLLSVPVLAFIAVYPLLKRFTRLCHYYLGAALGLAPVCAWIAVRGDLACPPVLMGAAVPFWTAGFDILYACQDLKSDLETGVFSVPTKLGLHGALRVARLTHAASWLFMLLLWKITPQLGPLFLAAVALALLLMIVEHALVWSGDMRRLPLVFFTLNGVLSVVVGVLGVADVLLQ
jgi:4-hydroxybenzoate polyprenyltransferase